MSSQTLLLSLSFIFPPFDLFLASPNSTFKYNHVKDFFCLHLDSGGREYGYSEKARPYSLVQPGSIIAHL